MSYIMHFLEKRKTRQPISSQNEQQQLDESDCGSREGLGVLLLTCFSIVLGAGLLFNTYSGGLLSDLWDPSIKATLEQALGKEERRNPLIHVAEWQRPLDVRGSRGQQLAPQVPVLSCGDFPRLVIPNSDVSFTVGMRKHDRLEVIYSLTASRPTPEDIGILKQAIAQSHRTCLLWSAIVTEISKPNMQEMRFQRLSTASYQPIRFMQQVAYLSFSKTGEISEILLPLYPNEGSAPTSEHAVAFMQSLMAFHHKP